VVDGPAAAAGATPTTSWTEPGSIAALGATLAVGVYLMSRLVTSRFYEPLALRPEDVELGYPVLLIQATGLLLWCALLGVMFVALIYGVGRGLTRTARLLGVVEAEGRQAQRRIAVVGGGVFVVLLTSALLTGDLPSAAVVVMLGIIVWLLWPFNRAPTRTLLIATGVFAAFFLAFAFGEEAGDAADEVQAGHVPSQTSWLGISFTPWRATVGQVEWSGTLPSMLDDSDLTCVLVLGATDSRGTVVYLTDTSGVRSTLAITGDQAVVKSFPDRTACDWPRQQQ
jgi:hypothetical protein